MYFSVIRYIFCIRQKIRHVNESGIIDPCGGTISIMKTNENDIKIGLVIMASGLSKRFGRNKLIEDLGGKPLIKWIIDATEGLFDARVVVTRSEEVKALCDSLNIECILHKLPYRSDTVRIGLSALIENIEYCFFTPADQPLISRESLRNLITSAMEKKDKIIRTSFGDKVGAPVGFPIALFDNLLNLPEGKGGSLVVQNNQELVYTVEVFNEYELNDIDTVADLEWVYSLIK